ncbi:MAG: glycosyltransferase [Alphaproteobacteria bacterium]|nr:glycosyltransferase [Alphaproteobacteria bacterium]
MTVLPTDAGVSFVVTVYNKRPHLPAVVAGLAAQRGNFPREFIFIDDGSTDGSGEELERLTSGLHDIQILVQANLGPSIATNRGIAAARHPLIKLVDGDDVLLPDAADWLRGALLRDHTAVLAFGSGEPHASPAEALVRLQAEPPAPAVPAVERYDALPLLLRRCDLMPSQCMIRRDVAQRVGGCDERVFVQDYSLFLRLAACGPFLHIAAPVVLGPQGPREHLDDGGPQVLHDLNLALFHFLSEHSLPHRVAGAAVRRGLKRAWRWARRREGAPFFDWTLWLLARGYLAGPQQMLRLLRQSCTAFSTSRAVRVV